MITIGKVSEEPKPRGVRKGTLTKKAAAALRAKIEWALRVHDQRLGPSALEFCIASSHNSAPQLSDSRKSSSTSLTKFYCRRLLVSR